MLLFWAVRCFFGSRTITVIFSLRVYLSIKGFTYITSDPDATFGQKPRIKSVDNNGSVADNTSGDNSVVNVR